MDLDQIRIAIGEANAGFRDAFQRSDATAVGALYTEDATLLPPNLNSIKGRQGIEAFWSGAMQMGIKDVVLSTVELMGMGDFVCEIGKYKLTIQPQGQNTVEDNGKYLVIWKQEGGTWKLHIDIWNTSMPPQ